MTDNDTADGTTVRERIGRLATGRRARVPLALVGVLLLVTSVTVVGVIETREEPDPDVDASLAIDRTEAATQAALRDGAQRAAEIAAGQPARTSGEYGIVVSPVWPMRMI